MRAFYLVGSGAELEGCVVGGKAGVPPFEVLAKTSVDDADSHLKQKVCTLRRPTHLLRFRHALVDDLVDGRLRERGQDPLTSSIQTAIVGYRFGVVLCRACSREGNCAAASLLHTTLLN